MDSTVKVGLLGAGATILAAVIGLVGGKSIEEKSVKNEINEILGNNVNIVGDSNIITINSITDLTENYMSSLEENKILIQDKQTLNETNDNLENEIRNLNKQIQLLEQDINDKENKISEVENLFIDNIGLVINSIEVDGKYIGIAKNGELLLSTKALSNYFNTTLRWDAAQKVVYIGNSTSQVAKEVSLWDKPYIDISDISCFIGDNERGMIGFSAYGFYASHSPIINHITYALDGKSKMITGTFNISTVETSDQVKYTITDENGNIIYTSPILTKMYPQHDFTIDTSNCLSITFTFEYTTGSAYHNLLGEILNLTNLTTDY